MLVFWILRQLCAEPLGLDAVLADSLAHNVVRDCLCLLLGDFFSGGAAALDLEDEVESPHEVDDVVQYGVGGVQQFAGIALEAVIYFPFGENIFSSVGIMRHPEKTEQRYKYVQSTKWITENRPRVTLKETIEQFIGVLK